MRPHVCPWWGGYFIDNALRRWIHDPHKLLAPYVRPGMHLLDFGCGMGFTTIALARLVGEGGQVTAVDLQPQMLSTLRRRASPAGVAERIHTHLCTADSLGLDRPFDFALAFYSVHEVPDQRRLLSEMYQLLRDGGRFLVIEPVGHVTSADFAGMIAAAEEIGFGVQKRPHVRWSHAALLAKDEPQPT